MKLILASTSRYRKALLSRLNIPFEVAAPDVDETPLFNEAPQVLASRLAHAKALKVALDYTDALVIGSDQVACCGETLLGKPGTHDKAVKQLLLLSGREAVFHTALCVHNCATGITLRRNVSNRVLFRTLTAARIERYLRIEQPYDCAGSAKSEGLGIALIQRLSGDDPNALIGLPLIALVDLLSEHGLEIP
ncbi:MAG: Maf family protein [Burkholderiales bacterium]